MPNFYLMRTIMSQPNRFFATRRLVAQLCKGALLTTAGVSLCQTAWATEGGIGRPITGMQVTPYADTRKPPRL